MYSPVFTCIFSSVIGLRPVECYIWIKRFVYGFDWLNRIDSVVVFEGVGLPLFVESVFELIHGRRINNILSKVVPVIDYSRGVEKLADIQALLFLENFESTTTGTCLW